jgi:polar amino acid transport system substrate-binding protein
LIKVGCFLITFLLSSLAWAAEKIDLYTYHNDPPFVIDMTNHMGLTYDLARLLTVRSNGKYHFEVKPVPRKRLNAILATGHKMVVPWVNPVWFKDVDQKKYQWSAGYIEGRNELLSRPSKPFEYSGPKSLIGKTIVAQAGGRLKDIDPLVNQGMILRENARNYASAMQMVLSSRAEVAFIPSKIALYNMRQNQTGSFYHI